MPDPAARTRALPSTLAAVALSALLLGVYARGGLAWPLGFVAMLPWLWALQRMQSVRSALLLGWAMSVGFVLAVMHWFAPAVASYTGWSLPTALLVLGLCAPVLQPQFIAFAVMRALAARRHGRALTAVAAAAAWVGCEAALPKLLGDTLGHGLQPAVLLRQSADLWGAAGLSLILLLVNEALLAALQERRNSATPRLWLRALACALILPLLLSAYGFLRLNDARLQAPADAPRLRVAMVQSNIIDYENLRREIGAYAVVRRVLDTHYALSDQAIAEQQADALLWSETVYPTPFGHPRSEDGAELDREIEAFARGRRVPLVFGTYDVDGAGEYNAAAFLDPARGLLGYYRKTHPFPLTEHVPAWMDSERLRRWLPWAGTWQPGHGPRVMPLRSADGREVNVLPMICLDAVHPQLAIDGARLGAQAIVGLSNDAWFTRWPQGAELHLAVASFRSIETRLPQLRVTTNGISAVIDAHGEIRARTAMGEPAVLVGEIIDFDPPPTLMLRLGDWVGRAGLLFLLLLAAHSLLRRLSARLLSGAHASSPSDLSPAGPGLSVLLLSGWQRGSIVGLQLCACAGLAWIGLRMLLISGLQVNSLAQIQQFAALVLAPALAAWALRRAFSARVWLREGWLILQSAGRRVELPVSSTLTLRVWQLPLPMPGLQLSTDVGHSFGVASAHTATLVQAMRALNARASTDETHPTLLQAWAEQRLRSHQPWLDAPLIKFGLFPLLPALIAFHLHQVIAFGGPFGEWLTFGFSAWLSGLLLWWASWVLGLSLFAAALRVMVEACSLVALGVQRVMKRDEAKSAQSVASAGSAGSTESAESGAGAQSGVSEVQAAPLRSALEWALRGLYYLGVPIWLLMRVL